MAMPEPTDAEWATIDTCFMLAFRRVRRERENAVNARDGLQGDYDTVCIKLQRIEATAATEAAARTHLEEQVAGARAEVASLEQRLLEARQEKEATVASLKAETEIVVEKQKVEMEAREYAFSARLEQAEVDAGRAALELAQERKAVEETTKRLEAQRDEARAGENRAISERAELQGMVADKDSELDTVRAELQAKQDATTRFRDHSLGRRPSFSKDSSVAQSAKRKHAATPLSEAQISVSAKQQSAEVIVLTDDEDELPAPKSRTHPKSSDHPSATAKSSSSASAPSTHRNATPGPGPSTLNNRNKRAKRSAEDSSDSEASDISEPPTKRARKTIQGVDDARTLLNQRVATIRSLALTQIPAHTLPSRDEPTVGWVMRSLFVREYNAHAESWNTHLDVLPSLLSNKDSSIESGDGKPTKHPVLFLHLDKHPGLPKYPGQPGTMIGNGTDIPLGKPVLVVVMSKFSKGLFVGRYIFRRHQRQVATQEWQSMSHLTRWTWTNVLNAYYPPYLSIGMRLATSVRRGRRITDKELQIVLNRWEKARTSRDYKKQSNMRPISSETYTGLLRGYDTIGVITMEPISVDERLYEEIWNKHLAGDCYEKASNGKKPEKTFKLKASTTAKSKTTSKSNEEIAPSNAPLVESFAGRFASSSSATSSENGLRRSARAPVQRVGVLAGFDTGDSPKDDEQREDSDSDFGGTDACDET